VSDSTGLVVFVFDPGPLLAPGRGLVDEAKETSLSSTPKDNHGCYNDAKRSIYKTQNFI
jgi:hypothetical protein